MATLLLSHHSSNPLEVGSSDTRNKAYNRKYQAAVSRRRALESTPSSDDPIHGYGTTEMDQYHNHLSHVLPTFSAQKQPQTAYVDLDEDMSDDELLVAPPTGDEIEEIEEDGDGEAEPCEDVSPESDEETTIYLKSPAERREIEEEIEDLESAVPQLTDDYKIVDRLGTGTFSSVYKAVDIYHHDKWDNTPWQGHHPPSSSAYYQSRPYPAGSKVFVAIKRIYVTSSPERIRNEISIMEDCRGCRHTSQLITAFRHNDQVVAIMPYHRNDDFREFFRILPLPGVKAYLRCMFRALRDIHARGIIHRDVKPANFLFDPRTGIGTLCDFGLASRMEPTGLTNGACFHTSSTPEYPHGKYEFGEFSKVAKSRLKTKSGLPSEKVGFPDKDTRPTSKANRAGTRGFRAPEVLLKCGDQTGAIDVWAVGMILLFFLTQRFPLFQSNDDTEALMEIATIIGRKRMENIAMLHSRVFSTNVPSVTPKGISWHEFVEKQNPGLWEPKQPDLRFYPYNSPSYHAHQQQTQADATDHHPPSSSSLSSGSNTDSSSLSPPPLDFTRSSSPSSNLPRSPSPIPSTSKHHSEITAVLDLLECILDPDCTKRLTPAQALAHPFLRGYDGDFDEAAADDEFVPHMFGSKDGVCSDYHFKDPVTELPCVRLPVECGCGCGRSFEEIRTLVAGEGLAIGRMACEFHGDLY